MPTRRRCLARLFHRLLSTLCRSLLTNCRSLLIFACEAPLSSGSTRWYEELAALKDSERTLCFMGCTGQDVEHFCRTCNVDMCSICGTKHTTDKKTRSHVLISYHEKKVCFLTIDIHVDYEEQAVSKLFEEPYCFAHNHCIHGEEALVIWYQRIHFRQGYRWSSQLT